MTREGFEMKSITDAASSSARADSYCRLDPSAPLRRLAAFLALNICKNNTSQQGETSTARGRTNVGPDRPLRRIRDQTARACL